MFVTIMIGMLDHSYIALSLTVPLNMQGLIFSSETHPERTLSGSSLSFSTQSFTIPNEFIPSSSALTNGYTVAIHFREISQEGLVVQLLCQYLALYYLF